jgi:hypothetical protein
VATPVYDLIKQAVLTRSSIIATYNGHVRHLSPHVLGKKKGKEHTLCYQFGGTSSTELKPVGSPDNWRCIAVDRLQNVSTYPGGGFYTASNHSERQSCVDEIDVEVSYTGA